MTIKGTELIQAMEVWAPKHMAMEKDRIGLQVGEPDEEVKGVLVALDVTEAVVDEAIRMGANWIVAHHAIIFRPLKDLRTDRPAGRMYAKLLTHKINVFIAHTNLDAAEGGVNDVMCDLLGIKDREVLLPTNRPSYHKIVVFIPDSHHEKVLTAMCEAGAGAIGDYSHCTFNLEGTGTFLPGAGSDPYIGKQGELAKVSEVRLETIVSTEVRESVIQAMKNAHPYEEVAYDMYPLDLQGKVVGIGRVGSLPSTMTLQELAEKMKTAYRLTGLRMVGEPDHLVNRVAVLGGSGGGYYREALSQGADVYITGDLDHHTVMDAKAEGLTLLDPGHHAEELVLETVKDRLQKMLPSVQVEVTTVDTNPFTFV
ncbi:Nif3-like dinuclear metal center hexameric protein [Marininema halotolerans]|uniref:GTP cyclohydrolase 1 type 2 homolog n=1 Tax=Marininema halotolerans TaxID=1155944 RepID=A0A1I6SY31_9BACL|nr:Nif3-like dinuclear metal center hexameric protein [Marininema halotolerans]SFS81708.1 dinuclear metal center protein, YbgI/SA1388 family [Marininema halotolerans]